MSQFYHPDTGTQPTPVVKPEQSWQAPLYPPQPETYPPRMPLQQPPRKEMSRTAVYSIVGIVSIIVIFGGGLFWRALTSQGTPSPASGTWTKTHIYSGNGIYKTDTITLANEWRIEWACNVAEVPGGVASFQIAVYNPDGSLATIALSTVCGGNNTSGLVDVHQGGTVYLLITSTAIWSFSIQELQ